MEDTTHITIRIPNKLLEKLDEQAKTQYRTRSSLINEIISKKYEVE